MVKLCTAAAKAIGKPECSGTLTFVKGYPQCGKAWIQLQSSHGAVREHAKLLDCETKECAFVVGKGQAPNSVMGYVCEDYICYPRKEISNVSV